MFFKEIEDQDPFSFTELCPDRPSLGLFCGDPGQQEVTERLLSVSLASQPLCLPL